MIDNCWVHFLFHTEYAIKWLLRFLIAQCGLDFVRAQNEEYRLTSLVRHLDIPNTPVEILESLKPTNQLQVPGKSLIYYENFRGVKIQTRIITLDKFGVSQHDHAQGWYNVLIRFPIEFLMKLENFTVEIRSIVGISIVSILTGSFIVLFIRFVRFWSFTPPWINFMGVPVETLFEFCHPFSFNLIIQGSKGERPSEPLPAIPDSPTQMRKEFENLSKQIQCKGRSAEWGWMQNKFAC